MKDSEEVLLNEVNRCFNYNPETGDFTYKKLTNKFFPGQSVGCLRGSDRLGVMILGKNRYLSILVWLIMTGKLPPTGFIVEHKDTNAMNLKWENLRLATQAENCLNRSQRSDNTSGVKGVSWCKSKKAWWVRIQKDGKRITVGYRDSLEEAAVLMKEVRTNLHGEFANHG